MFDFSKLVVCCHCLLQHASYFEILAKTMALGILRPGCFRSFHKACSTFFSCVALFFDMVGSCLYSVVTLLLLQNTLAQQISWKQNILQNPVNSML